MTPQEAMTPCQDHPFLRRGRGLALLTLLAGVLLASVAGATPALAAGTWWHLTSRDAPSILQPGKPAQIVVSASNLGYEEAKASAEHPLKLSVTLPSGVVVAAGGVRGYSGPGGRGPSTVLACTGEGAAASCTLPTGLASYEGLEMVVAVNITTPGASPTDQVAIEGGTAAEAPSTLTEHLTIGPDATGFGAEKYELRPETDTGTFDTQAGSHPFQLTTTLDLNQTLELNPKSNNEEEAAPQLVRNLHFVLPPGLLGNVTIAQQCSAVDFATIAPKDVNNCRSNTAIGVARITLNEPNNFHGVLTETVPLFNLVPAPGEPARFGIEIDKVPIVLTTKVRTGNDYAVEVSVENASQAVGVLGTQVTFWGVPGDASHNESRGWECLDHGYHAAGLVPARPCEASTETSPRPFLTLPTSCAATPTTTVSGSSWEGSVLASNPIPYEFQPEPGKPSSLTGCEHLGFDPAVGAGSEKFDPSIAVETESHAASTPSGMTVTVAVPQESTLAAGGIAEADVQSTTLALPVGIQASPGAANGLASCGAGSLGFTAGLQENRQLENDHFSPTPAGSSGCSNASKIGSVSIKTPLLEHELTGGVYLAAQDNNLLEEKLVLYILAEDPVSGVQVELAGAVHVDGSSGQLTSTFANTPQVPFETLKLNLFGGSRASQSTPSLCGNYNSSASFNPWAAPGSPSVAAVTTTPITITSGPNGTSCPSNPLPFAPSLSAGSSNPQAGAFSPFTLAIQHSDSDQALTGITVHLPPGDAALLSSLTPCPIAQADAGGCGSESLVGSSSTLAGLGSAPYALGGRVYLTGPYHGAPFGLSVVTPAVAGPFNLGTVIANSTIQVDPSTAAVTVTTVESRIIDAAGNVSVASSALPTIVRGIPVQLKQITVNVDREGFEFNPTNCNPMGVVATLAGAQGANETVSTPYRVANCAALPFAPKLTASTNGQATKTNGTGLNVDITSAGLHQANIQKVDLTLPIQLPTRQATLKKACLLAVFNANPAACEGAVIGKATIYTPVLKNPLMGPAYLVSHGGAAFPDVEFVVQGEGITLVLDGKTDIKKGITYSRFEAAPDAPFTRFETELPAGPGSILTAFVPEKEHDNLCKTKLAMPTEITAQDGSVIRQTTKVTPTGCKGVASYKVSRAQLLAKALKLCKKDKNKAKRKKCEAAAHKKYGAKHAKKTKKKTTKKA